MKSFFIGLIVSLVGMQLVAQEREYVIVVHGGAGAMAGLENDQEKAAQYYAALDSALTIGDAILSKGGEGPQAVMAVINYFESNPLFNAGVGATCTIDGAFELDAAIMEGKDLSAGAVAGVKFIKHPIDAAYAVKTQTEHVMLAGEGADLFAKGKGIGNGRRQSVFRYSQDHEVGGTIEEGKQEERYGRLCGIGQARKPDCRNQYRRSIQEAMGPCGRCTYHRCRYVC